VDRGAVGGHSRRLSSARGNHEDILDPLDTAPHEGDPGSIRRKNGRPVARGPERGGRNRPRRVGIWEEERETEGAVRALLGRDREGSVQSIGRPGDAVNAPIGHAGDHPGSPSNRRHDRHLVLPVGLSGIRDVSALRRPGRTPVDGRVFGQLERLLGLALHKIDVLIEAVCVSPSEDNLSSARRERRIKFLAGKTGEGNCRRWRLGVGVVLPARPRDETNQEEGRDEHAHPDEPSSVDHSSGAPRLRFGPGRLEGPRYPVDQSLRLMRFLPWSGRLRSVERSLGF